MITRGQHELDSEVASVVNIQVTYVPCTVTFMITRGQRELNSEAGTVVDISSNICVL